jgi:signal recognition particle subunit SRP54
MFDNLTESIQSIFQKVRGGGDKLTGSNIEEALLEIRRALVNADVSLKVIKLFLERVRNAAVGERVVQGVTPGQKFIQIVNDELVSLLGGTAEKLSLTEKPALIMLLGLQGSGKTTSAAKLALTLKKENKKVLLAALDLQRPAAIEQLSILGQQIEVDVFKDASAGDVLVVAEEAMMKAREGEYDVVIFDTAGRLQVNNELMAELLLLERKFRPEEKLLVVDALMGQEAVNVAEAFNSQIGISGSIVTKLDGDSRGGVALSLAESTGKKIKYAGYGEKIEPLDAFDPERMASRILGFGDIISLVKKAEESFDKQETAALEKKLKSGELTFETFLQMQKLMNKLGNLSQIFNLMGMNSMFNLKKEDREAMLEQGQRRMKLFEFAIQSMTIEERKDPNKINQNRMKRIAKGSGLKDAQVAALIDEFTKMRSMVKMMSGFQKMGPFASQNDLAAMMNKSTKEQKKDKKKSGGGPFGGGAFLKF